LGFERAAGFKLYTGPPGGFPLNLVGIKIIYLIDKINYGPYTYYRGSSG
jgi:hypothetical protein